MPRNYSALWEKGSQPSGKDGDKIRKECVTTIGSCPGAEGGDGGSTHVCQVWGWGGGGKVELTEEMTSSLDLEGHVGIPGQRRECAF